MQEENVSPLCSANEISRAIADLAGLEWQENVFGVHGIVGSQEDQALLDRLVETDPFFDALGSWDGVK